MNKNTPYLNVIRKNQKKDISRKTIIVLLIITILVTVAGTITVLNALNVFSPSSGQQYTPTAKVAVSINSITQNETNIK